MPERAPPLERARRERRTQCRQVIGMKQMPNAIAADDAPVLDDDGHFHVDGCADRPFQLPWSKTGVTLAFFWLLGAGRVLPVLHALRAERLGGVDRGDRALPADLRACSWASRWRCAARAHPRRLPLSAGCRRGVGRAMSTLVDVVRIAFFAYRDVLTHPDDGPKMQNLQDDDHRPADELSSTASCAFGLRRGGLPLRAGRDRELEAGWSVLERPET